MKKKRIVVFIIISVFFFSAAIITIVFYSTARSSFSSPINSMKHEDYQEFADIGRQLFYLYDNENITKHTNVIDDDKVKKLISKYSNDIVSISFLDDDVIFLSYGAIFQKVDGIAVTRNNHILKETYLNTYYDGGNLRYQELIPNVYYFTAGL